MRILHNSPTRQPSTSSPGARTSPGSDLHYPFSSDYLEVDAGSYDLEMRQAGMSNVVLELPGVTIEAGQIYDIFVIGIPGDPVDSHPLEAVIGTTAPAE